MEKTFTNPLIGMESAPVEEKIAALQELWVRYDRELEIVHYLVQLTATVARQYVGDALSDDEEPPTAA